MVSFKINSSQKIYFRRRFIYLKKTSKENKVLKKKFGIRKDCFIYIAKEDEKICKKPLEIYLNYKEIKKFEQSRLCILKDKKSNVKFTSSAEKEFKFLRENPQFNARTLVITARKYNMSLNKFIDLYNKTEISPVPTKRIFKVDTFPEKKGSIYHSSKKQQNAALNHPRTKNHLRRDFKIDRFPEKEESISHLSKKPKNVNFEYSRAVSNSRANKKRKEDTYGESLRKERKTRMGSKSDVSIHSQKHLKSNLESKNINSIELSDSPLSENELHVFGVKEDTRNKIIEGDAGKNLHISHSLKHIEHFISEVTVSDTSEKEEHLLKNRVINVELPDFILKSDSFMDTKHIESNTAHKNINDVLLLSENEAEACHPLNVYSKTDEEKTGVKKDRSANMHKVADSLTNTHLEIFVADDTFGNKEEDNVLTVKMNTVDLPEHPLLVFDVEDEGTKFKRGDEEKIGNNILKPGADIKESLPHTDIPIENSFLSSKNIYFVEESDKSENEIINFHLKGAKLKTEKMSLHCCEENKRRLSHLEEEYPDSEGDHQKDVTVIHHVIDNEIEKDNYSLKEINESNYFPEESESVIDVSITKSDVSSTEFMNGNSDHMLDKIKDNITLIGTDDAFELVENASTTHTYGSGTENDLPEYFLEVPSKDVCLPNDILINEHVFETSENVSLIKDDIVPTPPPASRDVVIYPTSNKKKVHLRNKSPRFEKKVAKYIIGLPFVFKNNVETEFNEEEFNHFEDTEQEREESDEEDVFPLTRDNKSSYGEILNRLNNFFRTLVKKVPKKDRRSLRQKLIVGILPTLKDILERPESPSNIETFLRFSKEVATLQDQISASPPGANDIKQTFNNISFAPEKLEDYE